MDGMYGPYCVKLFLKEAESVDVLVDEIPLHKLRAKIRESVTRSRRDRLLRAGITFSGFES